MCELFVRYVLVQIVLAGTVPERVAWRNGLEAAYVRDCLVDSFSMSSQALPNDCYCWFGKERDLAKQCLLCREVGE